MKKKKKSLIKRILYRLLAEAVVGVIAVMAYLHRDLILAAIKGETLPETAENGPAYKG